MKKVVVCFLGLLLSVNYAYSFNTIIKVCNCLTDKNLRDINVGFGQILNSNDCQTIDPSLHCWTSKPNPEIFECTVKADFNNQTSKEFANIEIDAANKKMIVTNDENTPYLIYQVSFNNFNVLMNPFKNK